MIEWLIMFREMGGKVILWTNRTGAALENAVAFCKEQGLEFDTVNKNLPEIMERFNDDGPKVTADLYIDDKAVNPLAIEAFGAAEIIAPEVQRVSAVLGQVVETLTPPLWRIAVYTRAVMRGGR